MKNRIHKLKQAQRANRPKDYMTNDNTMYSHLVKYTEKKLNTLTLNSPTIDRINHALLVAIKHHTIIKFNPSPSKSRIALSEYDNQYVICQGIVIKTQQYGKKTRLLIAEPKLLGSTLNDPKLPPSKAIFTRIKTRNIDSHIWLNLDNVSMTEITESGQIIMAGEFIVFSAKVTQYKGRIADDKRTKVQKFGLTDIDIKDVYINVDPNVKKTKDRLIRITSAIKQTGPEFTILRYNPDTKMFDVNTKLTNWYTNMINVEVPKEMAHLSNELLHGYAFIDYAFEMLYANDTYFKKMMDTYWLKNPDSKLNIRNVERPKYD